MAFSPLAHPWPYARLELMHCNSQLVMSYCWSISLKWLHQYIGWLHAFAEEWLQLFPVTATLQCCDLWERHPTSHCHHLAFPIHRTITTTFTASVPDMQHTAQEEIFLPEKKKKVHLSSLLPNMDTLFGKTQTYGETPHGNLNAAVEWNAALHQHSTGNYVGSHTL